MLFSIIQKVEKFKMHQVVLLCHDVLKFYKFYLKTVSVIITSLFIIIIK